MYERPVVNKDPTQSVLKLLLGNINSLGPNSTGHLLDHTKMEHYDGFSGVETHVVQDKLLDTRRRFETHSYRVSINPAEPTSRHGSHGGEIVATKAHISSSRAYQDIIDRISSVTGAPARFSAMYIRLQKNSQSPCCHMFLVLIWIVR